jgi:hypothetical protein
VNDAESKREQIGIKSTIKAAWRHLLRFFVGAYLQETASRPPKTLQICLLVLVQSVNPLNDLGILHGRPFYIA